MKTAKTVSLVVTILAFLVASWTLYTYATTTEEERAQQELEQKEQLEEMGIELPW